MNTQTLQQASGTTSFPTVPPLTPAPWWIRAVFVAVGLGLWFWTQSLIGGRSLPPGGIGDGMHAMLAPIHDYLGTHDSAANALLIVSSTMIDMLGIYLFASSIFGRSVRPFLGLVMVLALRQSCQLLCALPPPEGMIWRYPGFPSALVTYGVSNDLFFSGHTAVAVFGVLELARSKRRSIIVLGVIIALFEATTVLALRAHYTMDVFTGAVAALFVASVVQKPALLCDRLLARLFSTKTRIEPKTAA